MSALTPREQAEQTTLAAKVSEPDPTTGRYLHWNHDERDRWRELARKRSPSIRFAPSTEEIARRFGHRSKRTPA